MTAVCIVHAYLNTYSQCYVIDPVWCCTNIVTWTGYRSYSWTNYKYSRTVLGIWWRHSTDMLSASLSLCEGNPSVTGGFQRANKAEFWCFVDVSQQVTNGRVADDLRHHDIYEWCHMNVMSLLWTSGSQRTPGKAVGKVIITMTS